MRAFGERLTEKKNLWRNVKDKVPEGSIASIRQKFCVNYAHDSTTIEGNTLTLIEAKSVLEDNLSVGGKDLREIFEVYNHQKAFEYVEKTVSSGRPLDEPIV